MHLSRRNQLTVKWNEQTALVFVPKIQHVGREELPLSELQLMLPRDLDPSDLDRLFQDVSQDWIFINPQSPTPTHPLKLSFYT